MDAVEGYNVNPVHGRRQKRKERRRQKSERKVDYTELQKDILINILLRLTIIDLVRSKVVCKAWNDLISNDTYFAEMHLKHAVQRNPPFLFLLTTGRQNKNKLHFIDFNAQQDDGAHRNKKLISRTLMDTHIDYLQSYFSIVGSCNGLLCLSGSETASLYVCNPITGEYLLLPEPLIPKTANVITQFGFLESVKEYKVFQVGPFFSQSDMDAGFSKFICMIHTVGSNTWRILTDVSENIYNGMKGSAVSVHGAIHWLSSCWIQNIANEYIISFNMEDENLGSFSLPNLGAKVTHASFNLALTKVRGCLALFDYSFLDFIELWVMKEYKVEASWTRELRIRRSERPIWVGYCGLIAANPSYWNLLFSNEEFKAKASYDAEFGWLKGVEIQGLNSLCCQAISNVGSLISLRAIVEENIMQLDAEGTEIARRIRSRLGNFKREFFRNLANGSDDSDSDDGDSGDFQPRFRTTITLQLSNSGSHVRAKISPAPMLRGHINHHGHPSMGQIPPPSLNQVNDRNMCFSQYARPLEIVDEGYSNPNSLSFSSNCCSITNGESYPLGQIRATKFSQHSCQVTVPKSRWLHNSYS